jgi:DNA-binding winged helix-turn-helix (wHTH) protein/tetratricopeptide (TPR) repeat protein
MQVAKDISFGPFRLDLKNECLWHDARAITLRPKAFAVLQLLIEHAGSLVTKQEVLDQVWPGTFVGDAVLKDNIRQLREALNDDARIPTYIETAHRRGYRFIGRLLQPEQINFPDSSASRAISEPTPHALARSSLAAGVGVLGRDAEIGRMRDWLDAALLGERQTVFVTGEAGIGKTSVVEAFLQEACHSQGILVAQGQCLEHHGSGEAYLPLLDGFSRLCRSARAPQVLGSLQQHAPTWLAQMPSLVRLPQNENLQPQAVGATRERMLREMADFIDAVTAVSPMVIVLEDLHWSDHATLDLVSYLGRRRDSARLMVIGTYRPVDVILSDHPLKRVKRELQAHRFCQELALDYLTEQAIGDYLAMRFSDHNLPSRFRNTIYRRTEGNPLFMVNLIEHLVDQNLIAEEQGRWKLRVGLSEVEKRVPSSVRELIENQIERLSLGERKVLEGASVAGMECSSAAIAAGLDMPIEWVETHCEALARRYKFLSQPWLVELPDGTITPRHKFSHVLYLEVAYRLIPPTVRAQIHHRTAERGVAIYGDRACEIASELAMHFEQSRDWPSAAKYLLQAAEKAIACSAHHEAADFAKRGLEVISSLPDTADRRHQEMKLRLIGGVSVMAMKGFASTGVMEVFARNREDLWQQGPSPELFQMLSLSNLHCQFRGDIQSSFEIAGELLELAEGLKDDSLIMEAHRSMGAVLVIMGRCREALTHLEQATSLYERHHDHSYGAFMGLDCKVMCECFAGKGLWVLGHPDQASARTSAALALARDLGHPQTLVVAGIFAAQLHQLMGEVSLVHESAEVVVELASEYGLELWLAYATILLGWTQAEMGNLEAGIVTMQRAVAAYEGNGARLSSTYFLQLLADQLGKARRAEEALGTITKALKYAEESGEGYSLAELYRLKGELIIKVEEEAQTRNGLRNTGRSAIQNDLVLEQAQGCFAEALRVAKEQQAKTWELRAKRSMDRITKVMKHQVT